MITNQLYQCQVLDLGLIDYQKAYEYQKKCVQEVLDGGEQKIILCEHPAVLTLGRLSHESNLLFSAEEISKKGFAIYPIDRGGDVTLHSPGQLVVYPILNLSFYGKDLRRYLHQLEEVAIDLLSDFGIVASRFSGRTGAWVGAKKIVSLGVGVRKWVSYHGMGINVNTDLNLFSVIRPCGLDVTMTSIANIKNQPVNMQDIKNKIVACLAKQFHLNISNN